MLRIFAPRYFETDPRSQGVDESHASEYHMSKADELSTAQRERDLIRDLKAKLPSHLTGLEQMKRLNSAWYQSGSPKPDDDAGWRQVADVYGCSDNDLHRVRGTLKRSRLPGPPFSDREIGRMERRIARIKRYIAEDERKIL